MKRSQPEGLEHCAVAARVHSGINPRIVCLNEETYQEGVLQAVLARIGPDPTKTAEG